MRWDGTGAIFVRFALFLIGLALVKGIFQFSMRVILIGISRDIEYDLRNDLFRHLATFRRITTGAREPATSWRAPPTTSTRCARRRTTLTGRQWGIGPRVGAAWQLGIFHSKVVVRVGGGMYYHRGELFNYSRPDTPSAPSPAVPSASTSNFPSSTPQVAPHHRSTFMRATSPLGRMASNTPEGNLENPYGTSLEHSAPTSPKASDLANFLPNAGSIESGGQPTRSASITEPTSCPTP